MRRITWLGHATVLIEAGGARLLTDPVLRRRAAHLRRHAAPATDPGKLDAILISHLHGDHLHRATLRTLDPSAPLIVPPGSSRWMRGLKRDVQELAIGESLKVGGTTVHAVEAVHDGRRYPAGRPGQALGFVIERVYFAGDTEVFDGMASLGPLDAALVPIWGWGPSLGPGHMDPEQAAEALALLRPSIAVPIHWGTLLPTGLFRSHGHLLRTPAEKFVAAASRLAPDVRVDVLPVNGSLEL